MTRKSVALVQPTSGNKIPNHRPPTGIQSIAAQLKAQGREVLVVHDTIERIIEKLERFMPWHLGISSMSNTHPEAEKIARWMDESDSNVSVTYGGWHASGCAHSYDEFQRTSGQRGETETLKEILYPDSPIWYIIRGEGEIVYPQLLDLIDNGASIKKRAELPGIGLVDNNGNIVLNRPERITDLDALALPSWNGIRASRYLGGKTLSVHAQRNCRFMCGYCATPTLLRDATAHGNKITRMSPEKVVEYIEQLKEQFNIRRITFTDEDFFSDRKYVREIVGKIKKRKTLNGVTYLVHVNVVDTHRMRKEGSDLLQKFQEVGLVGISMGVETLVGKTIRAMNKEGIVVSMMNNEERTAYHVAKKRNETKVADQILVSSYARNIEESVAFAHENRVSCHCNCMVGTYGETREESAEGFRRFSNIGNLVGCYVPIFTPFPGTKVWSEVYKSGKLKRTLVGGIDWKLFDAEHGTIDIGYNPRELQRESKLAFYVSERYSKDMREGLERNPWLIDDFLSDISVQMIEYRGNKEIEKIYSELCDVKAKMSEQT